MRELMGTRFFAVVQVSATDFIRGDKFEVGIGISVLGASVVGQLLRKFTTETLRTLRLHRENEFVDRPFTRRGNDPLNHTK